MSTPTKNQLTLMPYGLALFIFLGLALAYPVFATQYEPLVGIPGLPADSTRTLSGYVNIVYLLTVSIGAMIAFIKITIAGVKYSMSDVITDKGEAKSDIKGALFGLAILLVPFLILNTIYGGLVNIDILDKAKPVSVSSSPRGSGVQVGNNNLPENDVPGELAASKSWPFGTVFEKMRANRNSQCAGQYFYTGYDTGICIYSKPASDFEPPVTVYLKNDCVNTVGKALVLKSDNFLTGTSYECASIDARARANPYPGPENTSVPGDTSTPGA